MLSHALPRFAPWIPSFAAEAGAVAEGRNVVENPVEAQVELIDGAIGKHVGFRQRQVASMVEEGHACWQRRSALRIQANRPAGRWLPDHN